MADCNINQFFFSFLIHKKANKQMRIKSEYY